VSGDDGAGGRHQAHHGLELLALTAGQNRRPWLLACTAPASSTCRS